MFFLQASQRFVSCRMGAQEQRSGLGQGPLEVRVPTCVAGCAHAFARRCFGTLPPATRGDTIRPPGEAGQGMEGVEQHEAAPLAEPRHGGPQRPRVGVRRVGGLDDRECAVAPPLVVLGAEGAGDGDALVPSGLGPAVGDAITVRFGGALLADLGPVVLTLGRVDMGQKLRALAQQGGAAAAEGTGGAPRRRRDPGLGEHASAQQRGNLGRIDRVVCGLAAVESVQREGMPQHQGHALWCTQIREPVPGEETRDSHHEPRTVWGDGLEQQVWSCLHMAVEHPLTIMVHDQQFPLIV